MPRVSVVLPTRGRRGFLAAAVESALAQSVADLEILIVNDERSGEPLPGLPDDARLRCLTTGGAGAAAARNRGIAEARAGLVAFLDDDDVWHPRKLELQLAALDAAPGAELVYCAFERRIEAIGETWPARVPAGVDLPDLLRSTFFGCSIPVVRREALLAVGGFDERFEGSQDRDLWLLLRPRANFAFVDEVLVTVRVHRGQISGRLHDKVAAKRLLLAKHRDTYRGHPAEYAHQLTRLGMMLSVAWRPWSAAAYFARAALVDRAASAPRELLREIVRGPARQRQRLMAEGFRRYGEVVHFW